MTTYKAHAKVNLGLNIIAKRGDGYHEIDTLMARIDLHDEIALEAAPQGITLSVAGASLLTGADNLAYRAAELYLGAANASGGVRIVLNKEIPVAAGLGGGSSDAAAVLRGLAALYPAEVDLMELGGQLGSDVPFFVADVGAARARGRGERLEPLSLPPVHLVLVNPGIAVSAKDAYTNLQNFTPRLKPDDVRSNLAANEKPGYLNALQPGVMLLEPTLRDVLSALRDTGLRGVLLSGSGSTCFGVADDGARADEVAKKLAQTYPDWWVRATRTV